MPKPIKIEGESSGDQPVRIRNLQGASTVAVSITIPKELNQTINGIVVHDNKTRSLVISELVQKGLECRE